MKTECKSVLVISLLFTLTTRQKGTRWHGLFLYLLFYLFFLVWLLVVLFVWVLILPVHLVLYDSRNALLIDREMNSMMSLSSYGQPKEDLPVKLTCNRKSACNVTW